MGVTQALQSPCGPLTPPFPSRQVRSHPSDGLVSVCPQLWATLQLSEKTEALPGRSGDPLKGQNPVWTNPEPGLSPLGYLHPFVPISPWGLVSPIGHTG
jgi:hypothetical protein